MATLAESVKFSDFCGFLRKLKRCSQSSDRKREFEKFFKQQKSDVSFQNEELLPFLRIILSTMDSERKFDIKEKKLCQRVAKLLHVSAAKLVNFDNVGTHAAIETMASAVVARMSKRSGDISVAMVNDRLDRMNNKEIRESDPDDSDFEYLFMHCGQEELIWIFNTVIRNVESYIGASSANLLSMLDDDAKQRWTLCRSLSAVVEDISTNDSILGRNFRPMLLAKLPQLTDWWVPIATHSGKEFFVELKYDGEHVLLHKMNKDNYRYFTRNGKDFSSDYGSTSMEGSISDRIHPFFLDSVQDCILDCELVMYDKIAKKICHHNTAASDGNTHSFRSIRPELQNVVTIAVVLFDILHYNGRDLRKVPLEERIKVLDFVLKKQADDTIYIAKRQTMSSRQEVEDFFGEAMKNNEEGIVVKSKTTLYQPGSRAQNNGWFKLKPNLATSCTVDLAVVGILFARPGTDFRDAYLIAARDEKSSKMVIVGVVSVGMADLDRDRIYKDATRVCPLTAVPHESIIGRRMEEGKKGGFIHPRHMNVVEVKCTGVRVKDGRRKLVDPVIKCIREKPIDEIDTIQQFEELGEVLRQCRLPDQEKADLMEKAEKERKRKKGPEGVIPTAKREKKEKSEEIEGSQLNGRTVCVLQGVDTKLRERCFKILDTFGAKNVANPVAGTDLVVAITRSHPRTRMVTGKNEWSVVDAQWLIRCEEEGRVSKWTDEELIHSVPGTFEIE